MPISKADAHEEGRTTQVPCDPFPPIYPPTAVEGCPACSELAARRAAARAKGDESALVDANVLMRRHLRLDHRP
ncbi:hypothetical protein ACFXAZ_09080 [Streptomyces sp. NPDC059477]|uniref:hypothetical protein n=1 Tax=Streptomyces sp. NPDC059477 TaxID=3346847 RepID=UPI00369AA098